MVEDTQPTKRAAFRSNYGYEWHLFMRSISTIWYEISSTNWFLIMKSSLFNINLDNHSKMVSRNCGHTNFISECDYTRGIRPAYRHFVWTNHSKLQAPKYRRVYTKKLLLVQHAPKCASLPKTPETSPGVAYACGWCHMRVATHRRVGASTQKWLKCQCRPPNISRVYCKIVPNNKTKRLKCG